MNTEITIAIATRNRPITLLRAINSIRKQTIWNISIFISDNSTNDETRREIEKICDTRIIYKRRSPDFPDAFQHFNAIIDDITTPYFMIFHDDDEMLPNMVEKLYDSIQKYPNAVAVALSGFFFNDDKNSIVGPIFSIKENCILKCPKDFVKKNVVEELAPFPRYFYRKNKLGNVRFTRDICRKYGDTAFLLRQLEKHEIVYLPDKLLIYHISPSQDSAQYDFLSFLQLIKLMQCYVPKEELKMYRIHNIYNSIRYDHIINGKIKFSYRNLKIFFSNSITNFFLKYILRLLNLYRI